MPLFVLPNICQRYFGFCNKSFLLLFFKKAALALLLLLVVFAPQARAEPPIKIGVLADMSGTYGDIGGKGSAEAARMAIEDFGGSLLGRPLEVVAADAQNKPDNAVAIVRRWFDEGVEMVTDLPTSGIALAVMPIATEKHRLLLVTGAGSSQITGKACSPFVAHWMWDTYAMAHGTGSSVVKAGGKDWYFITADYTFGKTLQADTTAVIQAAGGQVLGSVLHPLGTSDFSSQLLQAAASGAKVIGLANAGGDMINSIKQAREYQTPQKLAALVAFISDIHSLGIETAQGTLLTSGFYWDQDAAARAWSQRFLARMHYMPSMVQAGVYSAASHWLKAAKAAATLDAAAVMAQMRAMPVEDFATHGASLRSDGRLMREMYLYQVKTPAESHGEWDLYKLVSRIAPADAFRPLGEGGCKLAN